jgi:phage major head subunit gpT-like protein
MIPAMLAKRIMVHPEKLINEVVIAGTTDLAYDGVAFFSNVSGVRTFDNLLAGTGITLATLKADLIAALVAMAKFTDDQGEILNITGNVIYCPIALKATFESLIFSAADPTATGGVNTFNPFHNKFTVIGDARLDAADAKDWYLFATNEIVQPFIYQLRQNARPSMEKTNHTKQWVYGSDYRSNVGYGIPHLAIKTVTA